VINRRPTDLARLQKLEMLIGIFGCLTVLLFAVAALGIIRGEPSVATALALLGVAVATGLAIRARVRA
jgi:hypothetical protein